MCVFAQVCEEKLCASDLSTFPELLICHYTQRCDRPLCNESYISKKVSTFSAPVCVYKCM